MSYSVYYLNCTVAVPDHVCNTCGDDIEYGRIRSVAFIKKSVLSTILTDPSDEAAWLTAIVNKNIVVIPEVTGSFDGGAPVEGTGYGDQVSRIIGYNFTLNYKDPNYANNAAFYNSIKNSRNYAVAYRSKGKIHVSDVVVQVAPKAPIGEDMTSEVVFDVEVKWQQPDIPTPYAMPEGVFECFAYGS